jgi:hypothetical protein
MAAPAPASLALPSSGRHGVAPTHFALPWTALLAMFEAECRVFTGPDLIPSSGRSIGAKLLIDEPPGRACMQGQEP